jgi:hypothetical protein
MEMAAFWDIAPCSADEVDLALMMEAVCTSGMSVNFNDTAQCYIPEGWLSSSSVILSTQQSSFPIYVSLFFATTSVNM